MITIGMDISSNKHNKKERTSFEEFQKVFDFSKYLYPSQLKVIEAYVKTEIPNRNWAPLKEIYSYLESECDKRLLPIAIYDVCRWTIGPFGKESDRTAHDKRVVFFNSIKRVIEDINKIERYESGLTDEEVFQTRNHLRTLLHTQLRYFREDDGSPIQRAEWEWGIDPKQITPEGLSVGFKPDLVLLLYLFQQLKGSKHLSTEDRKQVARFFLFWNFDKDGKQYKEDPLEMGKMPNESVIGKVIERQEERRKKNSPYVVYAVFDCEEGRIRLFYEKPAKRKKLGKRNPIESLFYMSRHRVQKGEKTM